MARAILARGVQAADVRAAARREAMAAAVRDRMPGVSVSIEDEALVLSGRGLRVRSGRDAWLRNPGSWT